MEYGYVRCNCYIQGKTIAPKSKEFLSVTERKIDWVVSEKEWNRDVKKSRLLEEEFADWRLLACEHLDMFIANVFIGTTENINAFTTALENLDGNNNYPILTKHLPLGISNKIDSRVAKGLLKELETLEKNTTQEEKYRLIQVVSNEIIGSVQLNAPFIIFNAIHAKEHLCLGKQGFFVNKHFEKKDKTLQKVVFSKTKEMFRSLHFIQETLPQNHYKFTDLSSRCSYETNEKLLSSNKAGESIEFKVVKKITVINEEYKDILNSLKTLAKASIETGNSIFF